MITRNLDNIINLAAQKLFDHYDKMITAFQEGKLTDDKEINKIINQTIELIIQDFLSTKEKIKQRPSSSLLTLLSVQKKEKYTKGINVLWLLAWAAEKNHPEAFMAIQSSLDSLATTHPEDFIALLQNTAEEGNNKGISVLWILACAATNGHPEAFMAIQSSLDSLATTHPEDCIALLQNKAEEGKDKGKSVLWLLACAAMNGHPEAFMAIQASLGSLATTHPEDFIALLQNKAEEGKDKGKSVLWMLACAAMNGHPEAFMAIQASLGSLATTHPEDFIALLQSTVEEGPDKGISVLWMLACAAANGHPEAFMAIQASLGSLATTHPEDFIALLQNKAEEGKDKGKSVLWLLASAAAKSHPEVFIAIQDSLGCLATTHPEDFIALLQGKAEKTLNKGKNVLWILACAAANGHPEIFIAIKDSLASIAKTHPEDFIALLQNKAEEGNDKGISVLWLFIKAAIVGYRDVLNILASSLTQIAKDKPSLLDQLIKWEQEIKNDNENAWQLLTKLNRQNQQKKPSLFHPYDFLFAFLPEEKDATPEHQNKRTILNWCLNPTPFTKPDHSSLEEDDKNERKEDNTLLPENIQSALSSTYAEYHPNCYIFVANFLIDQNNIAAAIAVLKEGAVQASSNNHVASGYLLKAHWMLAEHLAVDPDPNNKQAAFDLICKAWNQRNSIIYIEELEANKEEKTGIREKINSEIKRLLKMIAFSLIDSDRSPHIQSSDEFEEIFNKNFKYIASRDALKNLKKMYKALKEKEEEKALSQSSKRKELSSSSENNSDLEANKKQKTRTSFFVTTQSHSNCRPGQTPSTDSPSITKESQRATQEPGF